MTIQDYAKNKGFRGAKLVAAGNDFKIYMLLRKLKGAIGLSVYAVVNKGRVRMYSQTDESLHQYFGRATKEYE